MIERLDQADHAGLDPILHNYMRLAYVHALSHIEAARRARFPLPSRRRAVPRTSGTGANPWESNGSLCTAPDFPRRLKGIQARPGRFVVVDQRRTRTAQHADERIPIRPGTDAFLLLAMVHVVFAEGLRFILGMRRRAECKMAKRCVWRTTKVAWSPGSSSPMPSYWAP